MLKSMRILILFLVLLAFACSDSAKQVQFLEEDVTMDDILAKADDESKMVMIDFYTDWCVWCKVLDDSTYTDPEVIELSKNFINFKVNAEKNEGRLLVRRYGVMGYPTILFINKEGIEVDRWIGYAKPAKFAQKMQDVLDGKDTFLSLQQQYKANKKNPEVAYKWGWKVADRNNSAQAKYIWEHLLKNDPENKSGYVPKAIYAITHIEQDRSQVNKHFLKLIEEYPDFEKIFDVYQRIIQNYFETKRYDDALSLIKEAMEKFEKPEELARLNLTKGMIKKECKEYDAAINAFKQIDMNRHRKLLIPVSEALFRTYYLKGDTAQITATIDNVLKLPLSPTEKGDFLLSVLEFANQTSYAGKALQYCEAVKDASSDPAKLAIARANLHYTLKNYEEIEKALAAAYPAAKSDAIQLNSLAWAVVKMQQNLPAAHKWAQEAIQLSDSASYILDTYAELLALNQEYEKAIEIEEAALRHVNHRAQADGFLAKIEEWSKILKKAESGGSI